MEKDLRLYTFAATSWIVLLCATLGILTGCSQIEGAGFSNNGEPHKQVICKKITNTYTRCFNK